MAAAQTCLDQPKEKLAKAIRAYLADIITRIVDGHFNSRIDELPAWAYPAAQPLKEVD